MNSFSVKDHKLLSGGQAVSFQATPNVGGRLKPSYLVIHYTAGGFAGSLAWLRNPKARASAHLLIARDGRVVQLAPFDRVTWHAGKSRWRDIVGLNSHSIGIELENYGRLEKKAGVYRSALGMNIPEENVVLAKHQNGGGVAPWENYPPAQIEALKQVAQALHEAYDFKDILGHDQISPGRKIDPGPAFPMAVIRDFVLRGKTENIAVTGDDRSQGDVKPLTRSRTLAGAGMASLGLMGEPVSQAARTLEPLASSSQIIGWAFTALTITGIALVFYARIDDFLKGRVIEESPDKEQGSA